MVVFVEGFESGNVLPREPPTTAKGGALALRVGLLEGSIPTYRRRDALDRGPAQRS